MDLNERIARLERRVAALAIALGIVVVLNVLMLASVRGAEPVHTPADAVTWAVVDLATLPDDARPFTRYLWIPPWGREDWLPALDFVVNSTASHARTLHKGRQVAGGWLLAYDLRYLVPDPIQREAMISVWDTLALQDPYFHVPTINSGVLAAVIAPHLRQQEAVLAAQISLSTGAVYRADWFVSKASTTLDGGVYYQLRDIERFRRSQQHTPQQAYYASRGVFEATIDKLAAEQRAAIFTSNVTGKPRLIDVFPVLVRGGGFATLTHDPFDEDVRNPEFHPIRNLLTGGKDRAREAITPMANGLIEGVLFAADGSLQDVVPPNVAHDSTIPAPYTQQLAPIISCWRCHGPDDGYRHFENDVAKLAGSNLDIVDDLGDLGLTSEEAIDRLAGLYAGELDGPDSPVGRARRDFAISTFRLTGKTVPEITTLIGDIYAAYNYQRVAAETACLELGMRREADDDPLTILSELVPPVEPGNPEDPVIGFLRAGVQVNRSDFEAVYADMALRANQ